MFVTMAIALLVALAAPVPKQPTPPPLYFPTKVGTERVYRAGEYEVVEVVTDVVEKDGSKVITVEVKVVGQAPVSQVFSVSAKGVSATRIAAIDLDEPLWLLKVPPPHEGKWEAVLKGPVVGEVAMKATAAKVERVEVPAGVFQAIPVKMEVTIGGKQVQGTTWYAPGVGRVKETVGDRTWVLKSLTQGKE